MATLEIKVPRDFSESMKKFIDSVGKSAELTKKLQQLETVKAAPSLKFPSRRFGIDPSFRIRTFEFTLKRFEASIARTMGRMLSNVGSISRMEIMRISNISSLLGDVAPVTRAAGLLAGIGVGVGGGVALAVLAAGYVTFKAIKWIWDKSIRIAEAMQKDNAIAMTIGTTVGGLRAFRVAFMGLPGIDQMIANMTEVSGRFTGMQSVMLHSLLGVGIYRDMSDTMVSSILQAQRFLQAQSRMTVLLRAQQTGITSVFTEAEILALRDMSPDQAREWASWFAANRQGMTPNPEVVEKLIRFQHANTRLWNSIVNLLGQKLADSKLTNSLIHLSSAFLMIIKKIISSRVIGELIQKIKFGFRRLTDWLNSGGHTLRDDLLQAIRKITTKLSEWTSWLYEELHRLSNRLSFTGVAAAAERPISVPYGIYPKYPASYPFGSTPQQGSRSTSAPVSTSGPRPIRPQTGPTFRGPRTTTTPSPSKPPDTTARPPVSTPAPQVETDPTKPLPAPSDRKPPVTAPKSGGADWRYVPDKKPTPAGKFPSRQRPRFTRGPAPPLPAGKFPSRQRPRFTRGPAPPVSPSTPANPRATPAPVPPSTSANPRPVPQRPVPQPTVAPSPTDVPLRGHERERMLEPYIRERAVANGIDPDIAVRVAHSEGLFEFYGDNRTSFGAFQVHTARGGGAVGDNFRRDTGLDPSDPRNELATIDYALRTAHEGGWGPWHGWRGNKWAGINRQQPLSARPDYSQGAPGASTVGTSPQRPTTISPSRGSVPVYKVPSGREFGGPPNRESLEFGGPPQKINGMYDDRPPRQSFSPAVNKAIDDAAASSGMSRNALYSVVDIESSGNPNNKTGSYKGLFQLDETEFKNHGGHGSIYDPVENARVGALILKEHGEILSAKLGRPVEPWEAYMAHQQGNAGAAGHLANPDRPAWQAMMAEGKGEAWAKKAISGNIPASELTRYGGVEKITSAQFMSVWKNKYEKRAGPGGDTIAAVNREDGVTRNPMYGFKGLNGSWNQAAFEKMAKDRGFEPVVIDTKPGDRQAAVDAVKQEQAKRGNPQFGQAGFSAGAQPADAVAGDPDLKGNLIPGSTVVIAPSGQSNIPNIKALGNDADVYPDPSSSKGNNPHSAQGAGQNINVPHGSQSLAEVNRLNDERTRQAMPSGVEGPAPGTMGVIGEEKSLLSKPEAGPGGSGGLTSPFAGVTDFGIRAGNRFGDPREKGRPHSGNDLHAPDGTPVLSMNDGVVLYNGWNKGYQANIVIKGNDGVIRRYATHGATENLPAGTRVAQGQRIGTVARGHVHYEEIIPTINGKPNPVYQEFERNASSNTFTSTSYQHGVIDPSGPQGSLRNIGTGSLQSSKVSEHTKFGPTTPEQRGFLTSPTGKISVTHIPVRNREDAGLPSSFLNPTSFKHIPAESLKKPDSTLPFTKVANMEHQDKPHESGHVGPGETKTLHSAWTHKAILIRNETSHNNVDYHPKDQSPPNPAKVADEAWSGPPIDPVGKGVTPQPHGGPPSGLAHILGGQPVTASSDVGSLPKHVRGVVKAIGTSETDYNINEAYKDKYNQTTGKDKNMNVIKEGERGKDYGFFQNNQSQVERGIALGMPYEEAQHLMGGTKGQVSTKEQQEVAMGHYLQLTRADEMKKLLMTHDFDATRKALSNEWFALERPNAIAGAKKAYESQQ